ncbi:hypothetical protein [Palleronia sp.]|uniref:hypothetical protein n=1 Tax=Palleronia sp. TaxID=1940284 RepID=UPI0035C84969
MTSQNRPTLRVTQSATRQPQGGDAGQTPGRAHTGGPAAVHIPSLTKESKMSKESMRRTLDSIRSNPGRGGTYSAKQIGAMATIEAALAKIAHWEANSTELSTLEVEQFKSRVGDTGYTAKDRELMAKILARTPRRMSYKEAERLKRRGR